MEMEKLDIFGGLAGQQKGAFSKGSVIKMEDLQIHEVIGSGGYGEVCKGKYQGAFTVYDSVFLFVKLNSRF